MPSFQPLATTLLAILSAAAGVWLTSHSPVSRRMLPFGGGVLVGVAIFWVLPEMAGFFSWPGAVAWLAGGFALLWLIDRYVYAVCPACSHSHDHGECATRLHGFALPLLAVAALHSAIDGWTAVAAQSQTGLGAAFLFGIAAHKLPEGLALGVVARAALRTPWSAFAWCALAELTTLAGAGIEPVLAPHLGSHAMNALLALAGGGFLYLGGHAVHGEMQRSGRAPAFVPALTGVAGSSVLRLLVR